MTAKHVAFPLSCQIERSEYRNKKNKTEEKKTELDLSVKMTIIGELYNTDYKQNIYSKQAFFPIYCNL